MMTPTCLPSEVRGKPFTSGTKRSRGRENTTLFLLMEPVTVALAKKGTLQIKNVKKTPT